MSAAGFRMGGPLLAALLLSAFLLVAAGTGAAPAAGGGHLAFHLRHAKVHPRHALFAARRKPTLRFSFTAKRATDLEITVVDSRHERTVAAWKLDRVKPRTKLERRWNGVDRRGRAAKDGRYEFRVAAKGRPARFAGSFDLHGHVFPVDGPHGTRGPVGEFGAPRNGGRVHEGFDITASCGTRLIAARGGKIAKVGYDPRLYGNYVLINGRKTGESYFYAHMVEPTPLHEGGHVKTGRTVGRVGQTGNAAGTPCHLHFELHEHGAPVDPEPSLKHWDRYS